MFLAAELPEAHRWKKGMGKADKPHIQEVFGHKMPSVTKQNSQAVHRLPKPSPGHHISCKLITFFMEYCNKLDDLLYESKDGRKSLVLKIG